MSDTILSMDNQNQNPQTQPTPTPQPGVNPSPPFNENENVNGQGFQGNKINTSNIYPGPDTQTQVVEPANNPKSVNNNTNMTKKGKKLKLALVLLIIIVIIGVGGYTVYAKVLNKSNGSTQAITCGTTLGQMCSYSVTQSSPSFKIEYYTNSKLEQSGSTTYLVSGANGSNSKFWVETLGTSTQTCKFNGSFEFTFKGMSYNGCYSSDGKEFQGIISNNGNYYSLNLTSSTPSSNQQVSFIFSSVVLQ